MLCDLTGQNCRHIADGPVQVMRCVELRNRMFGDHQALRGFDAVRGLCPRGPLRDCDGLRVDLVRLRASLQRRRPGIPFGTPSRLRRVGGFRGGVGRLELSTKVGAGPGEPPKVPLEVDWVVVVVEPVVVVVEWVVVVVVLVDGVVVVVVDVVPPVTQRLASWLCGPGAEGPRKMSPGCLL